MPPDGPEGNAPTEILPPGSPAADIGDGRGSAAAAGDGLTEAGIALAGEGRSGAGPGPLRRPEIPAMRQRRPAGGTDRARRVIRQKNIRQPRGEPYENRIPVPCAAFPFRAITPKLRFAANWLSW